MTANGPSVWTGRALQAKNDDVELIGLALLYPALNGSLCSWPSWISARARSHSRLGPEGHKGHLIANALGETFLHLLISTRRPRRESQLLLSGTALAVPPEPPSPPRPMGRAAVATWGGDNPLGEPEHVHFKPPPS